MHAMIDWAVRHARAVLMALLLMLVTGAITYAVIPREAAPEIDIPTYFITVAHPGIGSTDAERLLVHPIERGLQAIAGLDDMQSWAGEGFAMIRLDFEPGWDNDAALVDIRDELDSLAGELPDAAEDPTISEVDVSLFPVVTVNLSGPVAERALIRLARDLRDRIESVPGVLEADIGGARADLMEVLVDPLVLESYELSYDVLTQTIQSNNQLVAAGAVDVGAGRIGLRVPGTIDDPADIRNTSIQIKGDTVLRVGDVADVRATFEDPSSFTRINGQPSLSLEVRKQAGANIIDVVRHVRETVAIASEDWPDAVQVTWMQDQAEDVQELLADLQNNVISAILIVALVILGIMGLRASFLVGIAIPGAFLGGMLIVYSLGFTLNIVVLFSLILVVGMLVDGAVVVVELADRYIAEGQPRSQAFANAAKRMSWPITSAVATTLAVFFPMLFWPGIVGEFIIYLPATVIIMLSASLLMALVFVPTLGAVTGQTRVINEAQTQQVKAAEAGRFDELDGFTAIYLRWLRPAIAHPGRALAAVITLMVFSYGLYGVLGRGVQFFPDIESEFAQIQVQARGDLSIWEADELVRKVESRVLGMDGIDAVYARTIGTPLARLQGNYAEDVIGIIQLELAHWRHRPPAAEILTSLREQTTDLAGLRITVLSESGGPTQGRPVAIEVSSRDPGHIAPAVQRIRRLMENQGTFTDVEDDLPLAGVELEIRVDREQAARFGVDLALLGQGLQLLTDGIRLGTYRPEDADEEVDIRLRLPREQRHLQQLANLKLPSVQGLVPIANFATLVPVESAGLIKRRDGRRAYRIQADVATGRLVDDEVRTLRDTLSTIAFEDDVTIRFRGEAEDQAESASFLGSAFVIALFSMLMLLVVQFNRFSQALLVLSAILFSTIGVLLALLVRGEPFGLVMSGIGVLALAGIVVNNNIVLIDTYNVLRAQGISPADAALRTAAQRMRPVALTAVTTILALVPMVFAWTIDFTGRDFHIGAPSTDYWVQLATAVAGGLLFATPLTLLFTPAMLVWLDRKQSG